MIDRAGLVVVRIDHGVADSFSRSVMPTSARTWRRAAHCGSQTRHRVPDLAPDWTVDGRRCASFVAFGPSFDAAQAGLDEYVASVRA